MNPLKDFLCQLDGLEKVKGYSFEDILDLLVEEDEIFQIYAFPYSQNGFFRDSYLIVPLGPAVLFDNIGNGRPGKESRLYYAYYRGDGYDSFNRSSGLLVERTCISVEPIWLNGQAPYKTLIGRYKEIDLKRRKPLRIR